MRTGRGLFRDAWWELRGRLIPNPNPPFRPARVLFVCKGNICRSPFAARAAASLVRGMGLEDVECDSAGYRVNNATASPAAALQAALKLGVSLEGHSPKGLDQRLMDSSDVVVVMEARQLELLRRLYPAQKDRVHLLPLFEPADERPRGYLRYAIADPYGQPPEAFDACYGRILKSLDGLLEKLFGGTPCGRA